MYYDKIVIINKNKEGKTIKFYQRLKDMREDHELTQEEVAQLINTTQRQYCRWELGQWQMPIENYKILAKYYECSIDYLAGLCDQPTAPGGGPYKISRVSRNIHVQNIINTGNIKIESK